MAQLGKASIDGTRRESSWVGSEAETGGQVLPGPVDGRLVLHVVPCVVVGQRTIRDVDRARDGSTPDHIEGHHGRTSGRLEIGRICSLLVAVIGQGEVLDVHLGLPVCKLNRYVAVRDSCGPEGPGTEPVTARGTNRRTKAWVKVVNLHALRLRGEDIQSDEGKGAVLDAPVRCLVDA